MKPSKKHEAFDNFGKQLTAYFKAHPGLSEPITNDEQSLHVLTATSEEIKRTCEEVFPKGRISNAPYTPKDEMHLKHKLNPFKRARTVTSGWKSDA